MITYRHIKHPHEFAQVTDLEILIWGVSERVAIAEHTQYVLLHTGGCIIGAFDETQLVGFALGFATARGQLWSHIAAVHPGYQRQGIGYKLKQLQRTWAIEQGYQRIGWTFDPLMAANAHFNLRLLKAQSNTYHVNFYGEMDDDLNAGLPSDRLEITWHLTQDNVLPLPSSEQVPFLLRAGDGQAPILQDRPAQPLCRVEIPMDFPKIKASDPPLAINWRYALRDVFVFAFEERYTAVDFVRQSGKSWYLLQRR